MTDAIEGPLKAVLLENGEWKFPEYANVTELFHKLQKEDRQKMYHTFGQQVLTKENRISTDFCNLLFLMQNFIKIVLGFFLIDFGFLNVSAYFLNIIIKIPTLI